MKKSTLVLAAIVLAVAGPAYPQSSPRAEIEGGYGLLNHSPREGEFAPLGWTADFTLKPLGWLGLVGEGSGSYGSYEIPPQTVNSRLMNPGGKVPERVYGF